MGTCPVCYEPLDDTEYYDAFYACDHIMHARCSDKWDEARVEQLSAPSCPLCRAQTKQKQCVSFTNEAASVYACALTTRHLLIKHCNGLNTSLINMAQQLFGNENCIVYSNGKLLSINMGKDLHTVVYFLSHVFGAEKVHSSSFTFDTTIKNACHVDLHFNNHVHKAIAWFLMMTLLDSSSEEDQQTEWRKLGHQIRVIATYHGALLNNLDAKTNNIFCRMHTLFRSNEDLLVE